MASSAFGTSGFHPVTGLFATNHSPRTTTAANPAAKWGDFTCTPSSALSFARVRGLGANGARTMNDRHSVLHLAPQDKSKYSAGAVDMAIPIIRARPEATFFYQGRSGMADASAPCTTVADMSKATRATMPGIDPALADDMCEYFGYRADAMETYTYLYARMHALAAYCASCGLPVIAAPAANNHNLNAGGINYPERWPVRPLAAGAVPPNYLPLCNALKNADSTPVVMLDASRYGVRLTPEAATFIMLSGQANCGNGIAVAGTVALPLQAFPEELPVYITGGNRPAFPAVATSNGITFAHIREAFNFVGVVTGDRDGYVSGMVAAAGSMRFLSPEVACLATPPNTRFRVWPRAASIHLKILEVVAGSLGQAAYDPAAVDELDAVIVASGLPAIDRAGLRVPPANVGAVNQHLRTPVELIHSGTPAAVVWATMTTGELAAMLGWLQANQQGRLIATGFNLADGDWTINNVRLDPSHYNIEDTLPALGLDGVYTLRCATGISHIRARMNPVTAAQYNRKPEAKRQLLSLDEERYLATFYSLACGLRANADAVMYGTRYSPISSAASSGIYNTNNPRLDEILSRGLITNPYDANARFERIEAGFTEGMGLPLTFHQQSTVHYPTHVVRGDQELYATEMVFPPPVAQALLGAKYTSGGAFSPASSALGALAGMRPTQQLAVHPGFEDVGVSDVLALYQLTMGTKGVAVACGFDFTVTDPVTAGRINHSISGLGAVELSRPSDYTPSHLMSVSPGAWWFSNPFPVPVLIRALVPTRVPSSAGIGIFGRSREQGDRVGPAFPGTGGYMTLPVAAASATGARMNKYHQSGGSLVAPAIAAPITDWGDMDSYLRAGLADIGRVVHHANIPLEMPEAIRTASAPYKGVGPDDFRTMWGGDRIPAALVRLLTPGILPTSHPLEGGDDEDGDVPSTSRAPGRARGPGVVPDVLAPPGLGAAAPEAPATVDFHV